jgi:hypothetical protein
MKKFKYTLAIASLGLFLGCNGDHGIVKVTCDHGQVTSFNCDDGGAPSRPNWCAEALKEAHAGCDQNYTDPIPVIPNCQTNDWRR